MISRGQLPSETKYTARKIPSLTLMADVIISVFVLTSLVGSMMEHLAILPLVKIRLALFTFIHKNDKKL